MRTTKPIDLALLGRELAAAGIVVNGLSHAGTDTDGDVFTYTAPTAEQIGQPTDLPPEAAPVVEAHDASTPKRTAAFEASEDAERLALIAERAQTDPAFAALAELALRK